jgi:hypothetical protein
VLSITKDAYISRIQSCAFTPNFTPNEAPGERKQAMTVENNIA